MNRLRTMNASTLRIVLSVLLFVIVAIIGGIFYVGRSQLTSVSTRVNQAVADAQQSANSLDTYKRLETELKTNQSVVDRAKLLTADMTQYQYQNQIILDLQTYARQNGVGITNIDFGSTTDSSATTPAAAPATSATGGSDTGGSSKSISITITPSNPVGYTNLLNFVHAIEQNLPKMQISKLSMSRDGTDKSKVSVTDISIQMYVK